MIHVKENLVCLFGGCGSNEEMFKTNTPILLNDLYFLNISINKLLILSNKLFVSMNR